MIFLRKRFYTTGVTLVELIISLLILGIVLSLGYMFMNRTFMSMERQRQSLDTLHEARYFLAQVERDLREMTRLVSIDTLFKNNLFDEENALLFSMEIEIPDRSGKGLTTVVYTYEGPAAYQESPSKNKVVYRQEKGGVKKPIITKQMKFLKIWGTDGTVFRNRGVGEAMDTYRAYLAPHYYQPSNSAPNGLNDISKIRGVEVQLCMHEMYDPTGKPIKQRTFVTRIYSRVLNSKYD